MELFSMDFIVKLLKLNIYNSILVVVNRLSKIAYYILTTQNAISEQVVWLFFNQVIEYHRIPNLIISDYVTQFTARCSKALCLFLWWRISILTRCQGFPLREI